MVASGLQAWLRSFRAQARHSDASPFSLPDPLLSFSFLCSPPIPLSCDAPPRIQGCSPMPGNPHVGVGLPFLLFPSQFYGYSLYSALFLLQAFLLNLEKLHY